MTAQSDRHASVRAVTLTAGTYESDFHTLFDGKSIPAGEFNGRFLAWINQKLVASYKDISSAKAALAAANGAATWDGLGTFNCT